MMATQPAPSSSLSSTGKRKRSPGSVQPNSSGPGHLPHNSINPLSYTPSTLVQLTLAGLAETDELPSATIPDFPHRGLHHARSGSAESDAGDDDSRGDEDAVKPQREKTQAADRGGLLDTLLGSVHQFLDCGDVAKAARAYGLVVQMRPHGLPMDVRRHNLWAIGAEILMREGEQPAVRGAADAADDGGGGGRPKRWGSAANVNKVKAYYDTLIQRYPYDYKRPNGVSALDFWLAVLGCEVYNTHAEHAIALVRIDEDVYEWDGDGAESSGHDDEGDGAKRQRRRDAPRLQALEAMRDIARRMDGLMQDLPYSKNKRFLRLRAMASLYIADLVVPASRSSPLEVEGAKQAREREQQTARDLLQKMLDNGGQLDGVTKAVLDPDDELEEHHAAPLYSSLPIRAV